MSTQREDVLRRTRKMIVPGVIVGAAVILGLWVLYFVTGEDAKLLGFSRVSWLTLAIVATVAGPPLIFFSVRNHLHLLQHGVEAQGKVVSISVLSKHGTHPVTYSYTVAGKQYTFKRDTGGPFVKNISAGSRVTILYDPKKPTNAMVVDHNPDDRS